MAQMNDWREQANDDRLTRINNLPPDKRALVLQALQEGSLERERPRVVRRSSEDGAVRLSYAQQTLWLLDQLYPGSRVYNEFVAIKISGTLDFLALEQSLNEIVCRHEVLRTIFSSTEGEPVQVIVPFQPATLPIVDLRDMPEAERDAQVKQLANQETNHSFDVAHGPLWQVNLLRLADDENLLLVSAHHIILDAWSVGIFRRELLELYKAFSAEQPSPLSELPVQYADFAFWQRQHCRKDDLEPDLQYWTQQLSNLPSLLQLPFAKSRPGNRTFYAAREHFGLGSRLTQDLTVLCRHENITLFMALLGGFQILLYRYSNQPDLPVGTAVANRNRTEIEDLIGFFVNTVVLRGDLSGDPTVRELLQRVRRTAVAAHEHSGLPFGFVVEALQPERSPSYSPLFQVVFNLQNTPRHTVEVPGLNFSTVELGSVTSQYDLILSMEETPEGLRGYWQYSTDLFEPDTIRRMSGHLQVILQAMVDDLEQSVATLPILTPSESLEMLVDWNRTAAPVPQDKCIHHLFEAQVIRTPDAVAAVCADQTISYRELNCRANQLARRLQSVGVVPGARVGICMERSITMVVAILGVLKAGGAYVPLDPSCPRTRLTTMLSDVEVAATVTQQKLVAALPSSSAHVICLDYEADGGETENPDVLVAPDNLAYVIFTSGSTGNPKGVPVTHANLVHSTIARVRYYQEPVTVFLLLSPFSVDSSVAGIFWALTQGGTLVVPPSQCAVDMSELCRLVSLHRVSHLLGIPSLYSAILQEAQEGELASLRTVVVAGEPCPARLVEDHRRQLPETSLFNEYGPTEGTVWSTVYRCGPQEPGALVPIGRPIANTEIYLLDRHLEPVPVGVPGELHIGGDGVVNGYLNRPEATAASFISTALTGRRLYKTGDIARYRADGNLELLGRADQQVKVRGFRVELGELEAVLLQHPGIREAAVTVREAGEGQHLVAYVTLHPTSAVLSLEEIARFVDEKLPSYARPSAIEILENLPRLPNGKIDRASLPAQPSHPAATPRPREDWTEMERAVAEIWKTTLQIESVARDDNFFMIGGDSLSVIRVYNRLRATTGARLAITDLFKHPTISSLAQLIGSDSVVGEI